MNLTTNPSQASTMHWYYLTIAFSEGRISECIVQYANNRTVVKEGTVISGCSFIECKSEQEGSAIYAELKEPVDILDCYFYFCISGTMGAISYRITNKVNSTFQRNCGYKCTNDRCEEGNFMLIFGGNLDAKLYTVNACNDGLPAGSDPVITWGGSYDGKDANISNCVNCNFEMCSLYFYTGSYAVAKFHNIYNNSGATMCLGVHAMGSYNCSYFNIISNAPASSTLIIFSSNNPLTNS